MVAEIEERHELWGQPGKLEVPATSNTAGIGNFQDAVGICGGTGYCSATSPMRS